MHRVAAAHGESEASLAAFEACRREVGMVAFREDQHWGGPPYTAADEAAVVSAALDGFAAGIFLVEPTARIIYSNANGKALLAAAMVVREHRGCLLAVNPSADRHFRGALSGAFASGRAASDAGGALPLATSRREAVWIAHVSPLIGDRFRKSDRPAALASVVVREAKVDLAPAFAAVAKTYDLTPAEARALAAIINAGGVPQAAQTLGISETTAKTHLKRIFEKTGRNRQADLVKLAAGFTCFVS
jgi:DNA-binding CsgD family transcriptional regulator